MAKKKTEEIPELGDIAAEIKELGSRLKEVFVSAAKSERAKKLQKIILDGFDLMTSKAEKVIDDAKSGKLEADVKKGLHQTLKNVNEKLKEYSESIKPSDTQPDKETKSEKGEPKKTTK
jgi:hypothetical protein